MPESKREVKVRSKSRNTPIVNLIDQEQTYVRALGFVGVIGGGTEGMVDVKNGKIVRIRPLRYDWKYTPKEMNPWKFKRNGKTLEPLMKSLPPPFSIAYKKRIYSPNRILYPLKRVDWDPNGERNPQNRGKSKYVRISWDEASTIVANEIKRIHKKYGPLAVLQQADGHGENKQLQGPHGFPTLLLDKIGGYTQQIRNADSWEGWYWGSMHVWGTGAGTVGMISPCANLMKDMTEYCDMILFWGCDPETTPWGFVGQFASRLCYFWKEVGIKQVYICPDLNYGAAIHADKWIPILPNTDSALQLAIAYMWIKEGTYDKKYIATHTVGFDKFKDYVMGKEDGILKTPEWASAKCGVPEWTIKALAREFAAKITSISHFFGGSYIRGPFSHEPARLECILLGMQGLGKPGVHQCQITFMGMPRAKTAANMRYTFAAAGTDLAFTDRVLIPMGGQARAHQKQFFPKTLFQDAILNPPISWYGKTAAPEPVEDQFIKYTYPIAKKDGGAEIHMIWNDSPCRTTCWNDGNSSIEAYRSPKIECIVVQHQWLENDAVLADIVLPVSTIFEMEDMTANNGDGVQMKNVMLQRQAIKPIGEAKSDYEIVLEVAKKMGKYEEITEGKTMEDWMKHFFNGLGMPELISWKKFKDNQYYVFPTAPDWEKDPPGLRKFYDDPKANPLGTPSGKLEFYSERLARHFPDDKERGPIPKWIEKSKMHDERLSSKRAQTYPLLQMSNHGRWRVHAQHDDISWTRECFTCKVKGHDGYMYEPLWLNPIDAKKRKIKDGDIVKIYNERGAVLGGAIVWERVMPDVLYMDHGARCDWIIPGKLDRGGAINLISPRGTVSKYCAGMATSSYLVECKKVTMAEMDEWKKQYPEAFAREYDPDSGLRFNAWVEEGGK
jgi:molybdopterin guanine dinucleotide-containing S/N-oxide reductase-like protein